MGLVFDGTGSEPFIANVGISGDRITFISQQSKRVIDAYGLAVTLGFIDTHAYSEFTLLADPLQKARYIKGITAEINGNFGLSVTPLYGEAMKYREDDLKELVSMNAGQPSKSIFRFSEEEAWY